MRGTIDELTVRSRCAAVSEDAWVALCYQLPPGRDGLLEGLEAQRLLTKALRTVLGARAEAIAVFVVADRDGERAEDCARAWGATEVDD